MAEDSLAIVPGDRFVWDQNGEILTVVDLTAGGYYFLCLVGEDGEVWRYTYSWLIACQRLSPLPKRPG